MTRSKAKLSKRGFVRIEEVISTLVRHGLDTPELRRCGTWSARLKLVWGRLTGRSTVRVGWPRAVRDALIDLGPAFVKLGQILSVRSDLIPEELAQELGTLQEDVPPAPFHEVRMVVERELGLPLEEAFAHFEHIPMAAGSIAQVHRAVMRDGRTVAVKVKRPGIDQLIASDMEVVTWLAERLERFSPAARRFRPTEVAHELVRYTLRELDFRNEAQVATRLREFFIDWNDVRIPEIALVRPGLMAMEFLDTVPITDLHALEVYHIDREKLVRTAIYALLAQIYDLGLFHGDPHPGNLRVTKQGELAFLDFGIAGELNERLKHCLLASAVAAAHGDIETCLVYMLELATAEPDADPGAFRRAMAQRFQLWRGANTSEYGFGQLVYDQVTLGVQYGLRFPPDAVLFTKSLMTLDGVALAVAPDLLISREAVPYFDALARRKYGPEALASRLMMALPRWVDLMEHAPVARLRKIDRWFELEGGKPKASAVGEAMAPAIFGGLVMVAGAVLLVGNGQALGHAQWGWGLVMLAAGLSWGRPR